MQKEEYFFSFHLPSQNLPVLQSFENLDALKGDQFRYYLLLFLPGKQGIFVERAEFWPFPATW